MSRARLRCLEYLSPALILVACGAAEVDSRLLELEGPGRVSVARLGPVDGPRAVLSDGSEPDGLLWGVNPESVAVVQGDDVVAVGPGTAKVTGSWNGQVVTWTLEVHPSVVLQFVDPPSHITVGQRVPLRLVGRIGAETIDPGEVAWESSDDAVLAVSSGHATALHVGTAYVTAESQLGSQATLQLQVVEAAHAE